MSATYGVWFNISPQDLTDETLELCAWDSITRGTIDVEVIDANIDTAGYSIEVSAF